MIGGFDGGVGTFYENESFKGRAIRVRYRWMGTKTSSPSGEQAFSLDAGKTCEVNWTNTFVRMEAAR